MADIYSIFRRWFASIDQFLFFIVLIIIAIGIWVSIASTPAVALKLGLNPFHFVKQHLFIIPVVLLLISLISTLQPKHIRLLSLLGYCISIVLIIGTILFGTEIKGARRWLSIFGFSVQPSEFLKPFTAILTAWLISEQYKHRNFQGILMSMISICIAVPLLLLQPDVGMTLIIITTWLAQLFISGLSITMILNFILSGISALTSLYFILPHFADRINRFFGSNVEDTDLYQVQKSLEAFKSGGLLGKGPGEGIVKMKVPDCHSDFIFAVIGEEFGLLVCIVIVSLFVILAVRPLIKVMKSLSIFCYSAVFGIVFQIIIQVTINISTALNLIPTKGMTLPFISYGCSSMLCSAVSVGFLLVLTKYDSLMYDNK